MTANTYSKADVIDFTLTSEQELHVWVSQAADAGSTLTLPDRLGKVPIMLSAIDLGDGSHVGVPCVTSTRVVTIDSGGKPTMDKQYSIMWTYKDI